MSVNVVTYPTIIIKTTADWAADSTVYSAKRILVTSNDYWSGTDQRKFKIPNGIDSWAMLDYVPIGSGGNLYNMDDSLTENRNLSGDSAYSLSLTDLTQFRVESPQQPPSGQPSMLYQGGGTTQSHISHRFQVKAGSLPTTAYEIYGDSTHRFNGEVAYGTSPEYGVALKMAGLAGTGVQVNMASGRAASFTTPSALTAQFNNTGASGIVGQFEGTYPVVLYPTNSGIALQAIHSANDGTVSSKLSGPNMRASYSKFGLPSSYNPSGFQTWITVNNAGMGSDVTYAYYDSVAGSWNDIRTQLPVSIKRRPCYAITETSSVTAASYQNDELIRANLIHEFKINGVEITPPPTLNSTTGTLSQPVVAGNEIFVFYS